ncbi:MAG: DUF4254 domain-containing protein [Candidatus Omnitrophica bacterium]|nr:DUF4254 domain-containing protein [Candidatus Omnitrophota bacterium]
MAETLGSLVDKLTIKNIRKFHLKEMLKNRKSEFSKEELKIKIKTINKQIKDLEEEIDVYVYSSYQTGKVFKDEKLKLYNPKSFIGSIPVLTNIGEAISVLAQKNLELWHLEDEARRKDVTLSYVGKIKKKIDLANQQRNDLIDRIDELFEKVVIALNKK